MTYQSISFTEIPARKYRVIQCNGKLYAVIETEAQSAQLGELRQFSRAIEVCNREFTALDGDKLILNPGFDGNVPGRQIEDKGLLRSLVEDSEL